MRVDELKSRLQRRLTIIELGELMNELRALPADVTFHLLFPLAMEAVSKVTLIARWLLVEIEPACPVSCDEALGMVAGSHWDVSDWRVPFYLVTQFGKPHLQSAIARMADTFAGDALITVRAIGYQVWWPSVQTAQSVAPQRLERLCVPLDDGAGVSEGEV